MNIELELDFEDLQDIDLSDMDLDIDGFDIADQDSSIVVLSDSICVKRYPRPNPLTVKYEKAAELAASFPDLSDGEALYSMLSGNFIFGDFIEALMVEKNWYAEELIIATLSLSRENVDSLKNLQEGGYVKELSLIVSDFWYSHERRHNGGVPYILDVLGGESFTLAAAGLHTKVTLIKTDCGQNLIMHGSANLRSSRNLEQFMVENNRSLYDFNASWTKKILSGFSVTKKKLRGDALWQVLQEQINEQS